LFFSRQREADHSYVKQHPGSILSSLLITIETVGALVGAAPNGHDRCTTWMRSRPP